MVLAAGACASAGMAGASIAHSWVLRRREVRARRVLRQAAGISEGDASSRLASSGLQRAVIGYVVGLSQRLSFSATRAMANVLHFAEFRAAWFEQHILKAGLEGSLSVLACNEARLRLALVGLLAGALAGVLISNMLAAILAVVGAVAGFCSVGRALTQEEHLRAEALERELPEMLEVVSLGLRSGLTFDRSFRLYHDHFSTPFALACKQTQQRWELGFQTREEALRNLASTFDSPSFERIVDSIVRSLRFGSSLAETLEASAAESRAVYKAHREEQVAKAPIKMMVPTGALILPAMLLLVLGPILLELMGGAS